METDQIKSAGIVISCPEQVIRLVVVGRHGADVQLIGADTIALAEGINKAFGRIKEIAGADDIPVVLGVDSSQVRFMNVSLPPVAEVQVESLLKVQVETKLPVPVDQMSLAWHTETHDEGLDCTVSATKQEWVNAAMAYGQEMTHCTVDAMGLVEVWKRASGGQGHCVLLQEQGSRFLMAHVCDGQMQVSSVIDADIDVDGDVLLGELAVQDVLMTLDELDADGSRPSVVIISEPGRRREELSRRLVESGWDVEVTCSNELLTQSLCLTDEADVDVKAAGLAMLGMGQGPIQYDFAKAVKDESLRRQVQAGAFKLRNAVAITVGLIVLSLGFSYWAMKKEVRMLEEVLATTTNETSAEQIMKEQQFRESIARARPDMMDLWEKIQMSQEGVLLDTFEFEKGKPIKITAKGGNYESVYKFQKTLESQSGISQVKLLEPRFNEKEKKTYFTMTFKYKHFTQ